MSKTAQLPSGTIEYKSSQEVNFLEKGWEDRVPASWDFFTTSDLANQSKSRIFTTVIDVRNVNGMPHYHYFSNGTQLIKSQNWSSTKFMGAASSVHSLRFLSKGQVGADMTYNGRNFASDLDIIGAKSDNQFAAAVKGIGGSRMADELLENWLLAGPRQPGDWPGEAKLDTFGANWGSSTDPCGKELPVRTVKNFSDGQVVDLPAPRPRLSASNHISALTMAEWMKRIAVNFRDPDLVPKLLDYSKTHSSSEVRSAAASWTEEDIRILLYGTAALSDNEFKARGLTTKKDCKEGKSRQSWWGAYEGRPRGGMMWDGMRDWPHMAGGSSNLTSLFGKRWRTLGKGGSGGGQEAAIGWICLPKITNASGQITFPGKELIIFIKHNGGGPKKAYQYMHAAAGGIFDRLVPGLRQGNPTTF